MAHPIATLFALTMAVWVADVRLAPAPAPVVPAPAAACQAGPSANTPADSDAEVVVCGARLE